MANVKKLKAKTTVVRSEKGNGSADGTTTALKTAVRTARANIYDDAVKEVVSLSENDTYAKKIDNGPLAEARGKDVWALHAQLRAVDQLTATTTDLVDRTHESINGRISSTRDSVQQWITTTRTDLTKAVKDAEGSITESVSRTQSNVNRGVKDGVADLQTRLDSLHQTVRDSFTKLAKATAGTEENLKSQTNAFSKATESLLNTLQSDIEKRITEFRDEATRQVDKRFNQSDVAFAAVRADQEVIKALLTDIIKDRLGRAEPRVK